MLRKEVLKDNFSERNPKDNLGETPLHFAAQNGHLPVCQLIINNIKVSISILLLKKNCVMACKNRKKQFPKKFSIQKESNNKKFKGYSNFALTFDSHMSNFPIVLSDLFGFSS